MNLLAWIKSLTMKRLFHFSAIGIVTLFLALILSRWLGHERALGLLALAYLVVSLVFVITAFLLILRHYRIAPNNDIAFRLLALFGAVVFSGAWMVVIFPVSKVLE